MMGVIEEVLTYAPGWFAVGGVKRCSAGLGRHPMPFQAACVGHAQRTVSVPFFIL